MSPKPDEPDDPASPSCFAHEADDAYMGFASAAEIATLLAEVRGTAFDQAAARERLAVRLRQMLPKVRDDRLYRRLAALLAELDSGNVPTEEVLKSLD
jgi:hypothetical protein